MNIMTDLISYWNLNETAMVRIDVMKNNNLITTGNVAAGSNFGYFLPSTSVLRSNPASYLSVDNRILTNDNWTISGWFNRAPGGTTSIILNHTGGIGIAFSFLMTLDLKIKAPNLYTSLNQNPNFLLKLNTWYHLVWTWDGVTSQVYLNNMQYTADIGIPITGPAEYDTGITRLGTFDGGSNGFTGSLAGWGFWNRVLSIEEIKFLYNGGNGILLPLQGESVLPANFNQIYSNKSVYGYKTL